MVKVGRDTLLYRYLTFSFNVYCRFMHGENKSRWQAEYGLENSDFCRIVRVAFLFSPMIIVFQAGIIGTIAWKGIINPLITSVNPVSALIPWYFVFGVIGAGAFLSWAYAAWRAAAARRRDNRGSDYYVKSKDNQAASFVKNMFFSVKHKFCPTINFEGTVK